MNDYISRQAFLEHIQKDPLFPLVEKYGLSGVVLSFPAADVVEVVRCAECAHRAVDPNGVGYGLSLEFPDERCPCHCDDGWYSWRPPDDWFCANGERKAALGGDAT